MTYIKIVFIIGLVLSFIGCAEKVTNMTVKHLDKQAYDSSFKQSIRTQPFSSQSYNDKFSKAVIASLINAGLYSKDGKYKLKIEIVDIDQPSFGLDMTVTMTVKYTLLNYDEKSIVFQKTIKSPYTATIGDAFVGAKRAILAYEGSAKENIYKLLKEFQMQY